MKILIETIPTADQRYATLGDYWWEGTDLHIRVSEMDDWREQVLIAVHELVEATLCEDRGISEPDIMAFDISVPECSDPGAHPDAPYRKEHFFAENLERLLAAEFGIRWQDYEARCEEEFPA